MKKNVIILTHGWTGSSAFTALIAQAGYWLGDKTHQKIDYNTYENKELVLHNDNMIERSGYQGDREHEILTAETVMDITSKIDQLDHSEFSAFISKLDEVKPWIWKDPRLALTMHSWSKLIDMNDVDFIILTRDDLQSWITSNQRRHIQSFSFTKRYNKAITDSFKNFLSEHNKNYIELKFEDLQIHPKETIKKLNDHLNISLTMEDLERVYTKELYKKSKGCKDFFEATLIYIKNYFLRK